MLIYGDPKFRAPLRELAQSLFAGVASCHSLDELRRVLIQAGQLEQGLTDGTGFPDHTRSEASHVLDRLATQFYACWSQGGDAPTLSLGVVAELSHVLECLASETAPELEIKIPEGYEFYSLFPEQYCAAAQHWCGDHDAQEKSVLVVGIRSIGTSLSAVVSAVLRTYNWTVTRTTVRPSGHPFSRSCALNLSGSYPHALVVDEGPGLSGSSMAAVAEALTSAGVQSVSLFPGHAGMPGSQASASVLRVWQSLTRYTVPADELRWGNRSLTQLLTTAAERLAGETGEPQVLDLGGGKWREHTGMPESAWPAVAPAFEASKTLVRYPSKPVIWKFSGLGAWRESPSRPKRNMPDLALKPAASLLGYSAFNWVTGARLCPGRQVPEVIEAVAEYLVQSAGAPLLLSEHLAAVHRLREMLLHNTQEAFGHEAAMRGEALSRRIVVDLPSATYSDGRMAPWEWILTKNGLLKVDANDGTVDHTLIGRQSILWDLAAVCVEWDLPMDQAKWLSDRVSQELGVSLGGLDFYRAAWCAFRLGLLSFSPPAVSAGEAFRLASRSSQLREVLAKLLSETSADAVSPLMLHHT